MGEAQRAGIVVTVSNKTVWRWLNEDAIRPWQHRSWIFPRDPDFATKAGRILDLYAREWQGDPLHSNEFVLSADEKTSIQARIRRHPSLPPRQGQAARVEHEYRRAGAWAYIAALDVHRAKVFGRCEKSTGIKPFDRLVAQVMAEPPYCNARRVFWIVDNGSSHRGQPAVARLQTAFPNLVLVHTPVHASWLNQVEIYFSIVQRKALTPNDFSSHQRCEIVSCASRPTTRPSPLRSSGPLPDTILPSWRRRSTAFTHPCGRLHRAIRCRTYEPVY
jgi:hypothetical protein